MNLECEPKETLIREYNELLAAMEEQNISASKLGFVNNTCNPLLFSILIHCLENIEIFSDRQLRNINLFINMMSYGV